MIDEYLLRCWTDAIKLDLASRYSEPGSKSFNRMVSPEAKQANEGFMQHTLSFLRWQPNFDVNTPLHNLKGNALAEVILIGSLQHIQLLLEHHATFDSASVDVSLMNKIHTLLCPSSLKGVYSNYSIILSAESNALSEQTEKGRWEFSRTYFPDSLSYMKAGRQKLELLLCYGYRPSIKEIQTIPCYRDYQPAEVNTSTNRTITNSTTNNTEHPIQNDNPLSSNTRVWPSLRSIPLIGTAIRWLYDPIKNKLMEWATKRGQAIPKEQTIAQEETISREEDFCYERQQFIPAEELIYRLNTAIQDIKSREDAISSQVLSDISEPVGNKSVAGIIFGYANSIMLVRRAVYEQRKHRIIGFKYILKQES